MSNEKTQAKQQIEKLVAYFEKNIHQLKAPSFNETQTRNQLIDPFFEALGWDVHNRGMKPLYLQEVVPEGRVKTTFGKEVKEQTALFETKDTLGNEYKEYSSILDYIAEDEYKANSKEATKKPDYRFRIKGQTKFFLEAKKPSVDLMKSQDAIFQVKRYGFSGRVPVSILTDFEEFRVFDCTHKPLYEKPKLGIIKDFDLVYTSYLDRFDQLFDTFSRDAVEAGSLDALTTKLLQKRTGDFALDKTFLEDLSRWRIELARDIAKHPKNRRKLNDYTLNESVQRILDRIVFFRVCEDREIEVENTLLAILRMWKDRPGVSLYSLLNQLFQQRRALYNGLLFSPHECEELEVGDKVILEILENLNYPFSPYHFNEIGVEILGSIYEKFLGKTIHLTPKTVRVDEKPEVRKAGGVYYTPQYIVNYIVDNTVGKLLYGEQGSPLQRRGDDEVVGVGENGSNEHTPKSPLKRGLQNGSSQRQLLLSPKQVSKLKIIDIACGSGSFLLGAFQKLIDYHIEWYRTHPKDIQTINGVPDAYTDANGNLHISSRKKRDILVNNIYGVDIDRQAVEVTQMSLYLKVLEGENAETLNPQMTLALKEVYLPVLTDNIKCGNSLIGTDFAAQGDLFDADQARKINAFDWEAEFPEIIKDGGFDCVIGNPPYVVVKGGRYTEFEESPQIIAYYKQKFKYVQQQINLYVAFLEFSYHIIKESCYVGMIIPNTLLTNDFCEDIRRYFLDNTAIQVLSNEGRVFENAVVEGLVFVYKKEEGKINGEIQTKYGNQIHLIKQDVFKRIYGNRFLVHLDVASLQIIEKCSKNSIRLNESTEVWRGLTTGDDEKYLSKKKVNAKYKKIVQGKHILRYSIEDEELYVNYEPLQLDRARPQRIFENDEKLISKFVGKDLEFAYDNKKLYAINTCCVVLPLEHTTISLKYILGILNSKTLNFYFKQIFTDYRDAFPIVKSGHLEQLPIRTIDFTRPEEKKMHDNLVALVDKMLELHNQLQKANFDSEKEPIERQIAATDKKIDALVYRLYGLTEEEIKIVEGQNR